MDFINNPGMLGHKSSFVSDLAEAIESARNSDEWRHDYMTWTQMQNELIEEGRTQGIKEGIKEEVFMSVYEGDYSAERGAQKLNISIDKFDSQYVEWKKENGK